MASTPGKPPKSSGQLEAKQLVESLYDLEVTYIKELDGYYDKNYFVRVTQTSDNDSKFSLDFRTHDYVLKILNSKDSMTSHVDGEHELQKLMRQNGFICPYPIRNIYGAEKSLEEFPSSTDDSGGCTSRHVVRLLSFVPGDVMANVPYTADLLFQAGKYIGAMDKILKRFKNEALDNYKPLWDMANTTKLLDFIDKVHIGADVSLVTQIITKFDDEVVPILPNFQKGIIHGDFSDRNIIIKESKDADEYEESNSREISGVIDFGDSLNSYYVFEIAIAICHLTKDCNTIDSLEAGGYILAGYLNEMQLNEAEREALRLCVAARYCWLIVMGAYSSAQDPGNEYMVEITRNCSSQLRKLWELPKKNLYAMWEGIAQSYKSNKR